MMFLGSVGAAAAVLVVAAGTLSGDHIGPPTASLNFPVPGFVRRLQRPFHERAVARALPELLESLARSLRAGLSVRSAIEQASGTLDGPLGGDLAIMALRLDHGASLEIVLSRWATERQGIRGVRLAAAAVGLAAQTGGSVAGAIDGVADTIRGELALHAEVRSLASQAEASAVLVAVLPLAFAVVAGIADPQTISFMITTPIGLVCLVGGVGLDLAGFLWMRRITSRIAA